MKRTRQIFALVLALIMALSLVACGGNSATPAQDSAPAEGTSAPAEDSATPVEDNASTEVVKVGSLWPLTGGSASIGQEHADGVEMAIAEINANGGIKSMNGAKIELVVADTETSPDQGAIACERLITDENVSMILGAYNSTVCIAASEVAQRYHIPFVSMGGVATAITNRGYEYVFRVNNTATNDVQEMLVALDDISAEYDIDTINYALVYENSDWGADNARIWKEEADARGWTCVLDEPVTSGQADMTSQILKIKQSGADLVNVSLYAEDAIVFTNALYANQVDLPLGVWSVGGGWQDAAFLQNLDPSFYEYHFVQEDWDVAGPLNHPWIAELSEQVEAKYGYPLTSFFAQGWTDAYVAYYALEAAGSADPDAIRDALAGLEIYNSEDERALLTGYGAVVFDENGQNTYNGGNTGGTIVQYQDGKPIGLYPESHRMPGAQVVLPIPNYADR